SLDCLIERVRDAQIAIVTERNDSVISGCVPGEHGGGFVARPIVDCNEFEIRHCLHKRCFQGIGQGLSAIIHAQDKAGFYHRDPPNTRGAVTITFLHSDALANEHELHSPLHQVPTDSQCIQMPALKSSYRLIRTINNWLVPEVERGVEYDTHSSTSP